MVDNSADSADVFGVDFVGTDADKIVRFGGDMDEEDELGCKEEEVEDN